jgi:hypothetical protein
MMATRQSRAGLIDWLEGNDTELLAPPKGRIWL